MNDVLVLLPRSDDDPMIWAASDGENGVSWGVLPDERPPGGARVIALAPGAEVTMHHVALPAGSEAQARSAAPFAVEDEIALDVEAVHVALGRKGAPDESRAVAVVTRERMQAWLATLDELDLHPAHLTPDYMALTPGEGARLFDAGDRVLARTPQGGFTVDRDLAAMLAPQTLSEQGLDVVEAWTANAGALGLDAGAASVRVRPPLDDAGLLQQFVSGVASGVEIDLLQGAFRARRRRGESAAAWKRWRWPAGLAASIALVWLVSAGVQAWSYRQAAQDLRAQAADAYVAAFPDEPRVSDPQRRLQARLADLGGGAGGGVGFLELSAVAFESVAPLERVQIESLRFDSEDGALFVSMIYDTYSDVEAFMATASDRGVVVEEGGSRRNGRRMSGDLILRAS